MEERRIDQRALLKSLGVTLLVAIFLVAGAGISHVGYTQQDCITPYLESLTGFPNIANLSEAMAKVNAEPTAISSFMDDPRKYLATAHSITLEDDKYRVTGLNFDVGFEQKVFGRADLRGEGRPSATGVGIFFPKVGLVIQPAVVVGAPATVSIEDYLTLLTLIPDQTLCDLLRAVRDLDDEAKDSPARTSFVENPRQFLLNKGIRLAGDQYRLISMDFEKAGGTGAFTTSELRDEEKALTPLNEGLGIIYEHVGVFVQKTL